MWGNRVKEGFHHRRHLGLFICQYEVYLRAKSGHSSTKNEGVVAKILFRPCLCGGRAIRVKVRFHQGGVHLGLIIFQFGFYLYPKSGSSKMENEGVMTILEGMG